MGKNHKNVAPPPSSEDKLVTTTQYSVVIYKMVSTWKMAPFGL